MAEGVVLGTRTILAHSLHAATTRRTTTASSPCSRRPIAVKGGVAAPARIAKALALWRGGDRALAAIHLALARLPPIDREDAYRLHLADLALDGGVAPEALPQEIGYAEATARLLNTIMRGRASLAACRTAASG